MFDWSKFSIVANELSSKNDEEYLRSAIGRYYYSIFNQSRDYLTDILKEYEYANIDNPHAEIRDRFLNSKNELENEIGESLLFLRKLRNKADYNKYDSSKFFLKNINKAKKEYNDANEYLDKLIKNHKYYWD